MSSRTKVSASVAGALVVGAVSVAGGAAFAEEESRASSKEAKEVVGDEAASGNGEALGLWPFSFFQRD